MWVCVWLLTVRCRKLAQPGPRLVPAALALLLDFSLRRCHPHGCGWHYRQWMQRWLLLLVLLRTVPTTIEVIFLMLASQPLDMLLGSRTHAQPIIIHGREAFERFPSMLLQAALQLRCECRAGHVGFSAKVALRVIHQTVELLANGFRRPGL